VYNEGTTFTVTIPQTVVDWQTLEESPDISVEEAEAAELFTTEGYKVLVVDDNIVNQKVAKGFLKGYGFELTEAGSGPEAIELVRQNRYDFIFMDHMMPGMDGIEAVQIIRRDCGDNGTSPVIIALTANAMSGVREKFLSCGFQDFVSKPLDRVMLNEALMRWIPEERRIKRMEEQTRRGVILETTHIRGIDMDAAMRYHSGSAMDYLELLELYCIEGKRKSVLLQELLQEKDSQRYGVEVHGLKSASANIGATKLSDMARAHEEAAGREDEAFILEGFPQLLDAYEKQIENIREFLDRKRETENDPGLGELSSQELQRSLREALELLEDFHSRECAEKLEEVCRYRLDTDTAARLQEVREQLRLYEDDMAEELLHQLIERLEEPDTEET
ncbi:MAG: response regulator, partial [Acetatifactor sp.]|nr:response regulator [Acetatifactor sp.]